jgi:hypothetical protein
VAGALALLAATLTASRVTAYRRSEVKSRDSGAWITLLSTSGFWGN